MVMTEVEQQEQVPPLSKGTGLNKQFAAIVCNAEHDKREKGERDTSQTPSTSDETTTGESDDSERRGDNSNDESRPQHSKKGNIEGLEGSRSPDCHKKETAASNLSVQGLPRAWVPGEHIGKGSFGRVFRAMNLDNGEEFAVKEVVIQSHMDESDLDMLLREIEVMRSLRHENIVRYLGYEFNLKQSRLLIYQEWIPGNSLASRLSTYGAFSAGVTRSYTRQLLQGLQYLHSKGVLHMDIKCANLLLDKGGVIKLADFGTAEWVDNGPVKGKEGQSSGKWGRRGTPLFMAPEVLTKRDYSTAADIWSVGGTVMQMATLKPPYADMKFTTAVQLHRYVLQSQEGPPVPNIKPVELKQFIQDCFAWNRKERPSARQLLSHPFLREKRPSGNSGGLSGSNSGGGGSGPLDNSNVHICVGSGRLGGGVAGVASWQQPETWEEVKAEIVNGLRQQHQTALCPRIGDMPSSSSSNLGLAGTGGGGGCGDGGSSRRSSRSGRHQRRRTETHSIPALRTKRSDSGVDGSSSGGGGGVVVAGDSLDHSTGDVSVSGGNLAKHLNTLTLDITPPSNADFAVDLIDFSHPHVSSNLKGQQQHQHHHHQHQQHHDQQQQQHHHGLDSSEQNPFGLRRVPSPQRRGGALTRTRHHGRIKPLRAKAGSMPDVLTAVENDRERAMLASAAAAGAGLPNKGGRVRRMSTPLSAGAVADAAAAAALAVVEREADFDGHQSSSNLRRQQQQQHHQQQQGQERIMRGSEPQLDNGSAVHISREVVDAKLLNPNPTRRSHTADNLLSTSSSVSSRRRHSSASVTIHVNDSDSDDGEGDEEVVVLVTSTDSVDVPVMKRKEEGRRSGGIKASGSGGVGVISDCGGVSGGKALEADRNVSSPSPLSFVQSPLSSDGNEAEEDPMTEGELSDEAVASTATMPMRSHHQYDSVRQEQFRQQHQHQHQPRHHQHQQQQQQLQHQHRCSSGNIAVGNQPQAGHADYTAAHHNATTTTKVMVDVPLLVSPAGSPSFLHGAGVHDMFTGGSQSDADPVRNQQRIRRCMVDEMSSPSQSMSPLPRRVNGRHRVRSSMNIRSKLRLPGMPFMSPTRVASSPSLSSTAAAADVSTSSSYSIGPFGQGQGSLFKRLMAIRRADRGGGRVMGGGGSGSSSPGGMSSRSSEESLSKHNTGSDGQQHSVMDYTSSSSSSTPSSSNTSPTIQQRKHYDHDHQQQQQQPQHHHHHHHQQQQEKLGLVRSPTGHS